MKVKISKWGNSLAVRLPKPLAEELSLVAGRELDIEKQGSQLRIETASSPKIPVYRLEDLLAQIKPGQRPPPFEDWSAVEAPWPDDDWSGIAPTDKEWKAMKRGAQKRGKRRNRRA
jgi:antitoxin MazE